MGFDDIELQRLLEAQDNAPGLTDADAAPEVQADPVQSRAICGSRKSSDHLRRFTDPQMSRASSATRTRNCSSPIRRMGSSSTVNGAIARV